MVRLRLRRRNESFGFVSSVQSMQRFYEVISPGALDGLIAINISYYGIHNDWFVDTPRWIVFGY